MFERDLWKGRVLNVGVWKECGVKGFGLGEAGMECKRVG